MRTLASQSTGIILLAFTTLLAQDQAKGVPAPHGGHQVIRLVRLGGRIKPAEQNPNSHFQKITFSVYLRASSSRAMWAETHIVAPDDAGRYEVLLGSETAGGVPAEFFGSSDAAPSVAFRPQLVWIQTQVEPWMVEDGAANPLPHLLKFAGEAREPQDQIREGLVSMTFALHTQPEGGESLWSETQQVVVGNDGAYEALLGRTTSEGVLANLFAGRTFALNGSAEPEPRWLSVEMEGETTPRSRVLVAATSVNLGAENSAVFGRRHPVVLSDPLRPLVAASQLRRRNRLASSSVSPQLATNSASMPGSTYLVDAVNGSDTNDGITAPWKTIAKVNATSFQPGDQILFHAGEVWHEKLIVSSSGVAGSPVVYSSYGLGAKPILEEDGVRYPAVQISGRSYVTVKYLQAQNMTNVAVWVNGSSNVRIEGIAIKNCRNHGVAVDSVSPNVVVYNNTLSLDPGFAMTGSFVYVNSSVSAVTISYNKATLNGSLGNSNGIFVFDASNAIIHHNTITGATIGIGVNSWTRSISGEQVYANAVYNADSSFGDGESIEFTGTANYSVSGSIYQNFVKGGAKTVGGIDGVYSPNTAIYSNIAIGPFSNSAFHWTSYCRGLQFYSNTATAALYGLLIGSGSSADIRNNILTNFSSRGIAVEGTTGSTEDYNLFYNSGANYGVAPGSNSLIADPQFIRSTPVASGDVELKSTSPAVYSGSILGSKFQYALDPLCPNFAYTTVDQNTLGASWTRGAFAYR